MCVERRKVRSIRWIGHMVSGGEVVACRQPLYEDGGRRRPSGLSGSYARDCHGMDVDGGARNITARFPHLRGPSEY